MESVEQAYLNKLSEHEALCALAFACIVWDLPPLDEMWNEFNPDDQKDEYWTANIMFSDSIVAISNYNLHDLSQVQMVLTVLDETQHDLVERVKELLWLPASEDSEE